MRLLVLSHSCATAVNRGIYARIRELTGWHVSLIVPARWRDEFGNTLEEAASSGLDELRHIPVFANGSIIMHGYKTSMTKLFKQARPDLLYVNHEPYAVATAQACWANMRSIKVPFGFYSCQNIRKSYPPPFSWAEKMVYRNSSFAFPITDEVSRVLSEKGFRGERTVCSLPLDSGKYHVGLRGSRPDSFPAAGEELVIGFVGRLTEAKGLRTLATALGELADSRWHLVVVGTGEFQEEFERLLEVAKVRPRVTFAGYVPHEETPKWLAAMDVLVLPSETQPNWKEQFGRVIPEALACGAAVVGSDSGEIPNLIKQSSGGLVFRERDPDALAEALRAMMTEPRRREEMASVGRDWVLENISLDAVAKRMIETFKAAIDRED